MRITLIFITMLLIRCYSSAQNIEFAGKYWIPEVIDWKSPTSGIPEIDKRKTEGFKTIYFATDSLFYFVSSEQELLDNDSIAYGIEPGFKVYRGNYLIKNNKMFIEYCQIYGTFFIDTKTVKDTIVIGNGEPPTLLIESKRYINTKKYSIYSRQKISGQVKMAEDDLLKKKNK